LEKEGSNIYENLTKKEIQMLNRERIKLADQHRGIKDMKRLPDVVVVVDANHEITAVQEARLLEIPVVGIVDTNTNPNSVDYPIPANDDSIRTIQLIIAAISDEILSSADKENVSENVEPETQENVDEIVDVSAGENGKTAVLETEKVETSAEETTDKTKEDVTVAEEKVDDKIEKVKTEKTDTSKDVKESKIAASKKTKPKKTKKVDNKTKAKELSEATEEK
jgi:ribosomal protein S2